MPGPTPTGVIPPWAVSLLLSALALFTAIMIGLLSWQLLTVTQLKSDVGILQERNNSLEGRVKSIEVSGIDERYRAPKAAEKHRDMARESDNAHKAIYVVINSMRIYFQALIDGINRRFIRNEALIEKGRSYATGKERPYTGTDATLDRERVQSLIQALAERIKALKDGMQALRDKISGAAIATIANEKWNERQQRQIDALQKQLNVSAETSRLKFEMPTVIRAGAK